LISSWKSLSFFPSVTDIKSVEVWAEIGVIVLLFSLGLEFSFKAHESGRNRLYYRTQIIVMVLMGF
jgi:CPA2 family monovalent cation:H+ antiporter-2